MKIISHRGAAGLAPENTVSGIKIARKYKVKYIEVDAQITKDGKWVLMHDETFRDKNDRLLKVKNSTLSEIKKNSVQNNIATLEDAFKAAGKIPLLIDCKGADWGPVLEKTLNKYKVPKPIVASDDSRQLFAFRQRVPEADCFLSELIKPFETLQTARALHFSGICMLYSIYNPLVYFLAKRSGLRMTMYTVNRPVYAWFLHFFYPDVLITTDFPDRFAPKRKFKKVIKRKKRR